MKHYVVSNPHQGKNLFKISAPPADRTSSQLN